MTEIITTPNDWRADRLAELVRSERVLVRHCWKTASGKVETACSIHPEFQSTMWPITREADKDPIPLER